MAMMALRRASPPLRRAASPLSPARTGMRRMRGTTSRSWKMRTPTVKRPWGASISPRAVRERRTTAVEERARTKPKRMERCVVSPRKRRATAMATVVSPT
ncbi:MAG: hypothetical protein HOH95_03940 [Dehalococcoidia bacterium]|nr:hypothetical protein [Dehalococcoidia bacterium]